MLAELRFSNFRVNFSNMHSNNTLFNLAIFSILYMFIGIQAQAQTYINELMASNQEAVYDDFFEFDDWVELYHEGGVLNLAGYYLSDREDNLTKYEIPSTNAGITTITPGGHLVFWLENFFKFSKSFLVKIMNLDHFSLKKSARGVNGTT